MYFYFDHFLTLLRMNHTTFPVAKNLQVLQHSILTPTLRHFNDYGVLAIGYMQSDQRSLFRAVWFPRDSLVQQFYHYVVIGHEYQYGI